MKKSLILAAVAALLAPALALALCSCGASGLSNDEIRNTFRSLVEASYPLNDVYYGDGLPYERNDSVMAYLAGVSADTDGFKVSYMPVAEDSPYKSEAEIREATKAVFSDEMCELLFALGFEGMSTAEDETIAFARYIEQQEILTVRVDLAGDAIPMGRTFDFDAMTVIADEPDRIRASFPSSIDGKKSVDVRITIINTPEGWRLDSPTY